MKPYRRRPPLRHLVAAVAVAIMVAVAMTVPRDGERTGAVVHPPAPDPSIAAATGEDARAVATTPTDAEPRPPASRTGEAPSMVRTVSGPGVPPLVAGDTPPQRVAPPKKPDPPPPPIVPRRLGLVKMEDTATFSVGDIRVRLPGVAITGPEEICRDRAGTQWPCGRRALVGVRAAVRGRTVECPLPDKVRRGDFVTDCSLAGVDMAERIVASGWARALDRDGRLGAAERQAEARGLGLHGAATAIGVDPFPDPGEVPIDRTTAPLVGGPPP